MLNFLLPHIAQIIGGLFALVIIGRAAKAHRSSGSTIAWALGIVLLPYIGIPLYFAFGGRKFAHRDATKRLPAADRRGGHVVDAPLERMLDSVGAPPSTRDNAVELLTTGEVAYAEVMRVIDEATSSIHVQTLIFSGDAVGAAIAERLAARARQGVQVRLLVDGWFQLRSKGSQIRALRRAGAQVEWFKPILSTPLRTHANLRLHRKTVIADERVAIIGGMNIASEYMGPTPLAGRWLDLSAKIRGPAVRDLANVFASDWEFATRERLTTREPIAIADAQSIVQVVGSGPDVTTDLLYDAFLQSIFDAKERIWVATPYFVPDELLTRAFVLATRRGVDVRLLVPLKSNHPSADLAGASYLRDIARAGGKVRCYRPGMLHAKAFLADSALAVIGSANMDLRSLFLNYELGVLLRSARDITAVEAWFESVFPDCVDLPPPSRRRAALEALGRLIAPLE